MQATPEWNKAVARRFIDEVWNRGQLGVLEEVVAADAVLHLGAVSISAGPEATRGIVSNWRAAFPDLHLELGDLMAEADRAVVRVRLTGTHAGVFHYGSLVLQPSGMQMDIGEIFITRFAAGKMAESWAQFDQLGMLQQLGAVGVQIPTGGVK